MMPAAAPLSPATLQGAFLFAVSTLFSIVNPFGRALLFHAIVQDQPPKARRLLAAKVAAASLGVLLGALWFGAYILAWFGISVGALQIGGGLVVAANAWGLLLEPEKHEARNEAHVDQARALDGDLAFFPLTIPLTAGPGAIAVAITLSTQRPTNAYAALTFLEGASLAAVTVAVLIWASYSWSDLVERVVGHLGARVLSRVVAFLLICVGVQVASVGLHSLRLAP